MLTTPKGIRRNNPLNLMRTDPRQGWAGAVGDVQIDADREEAFISPMWGLRAGGIVLLNDEKRRGLWTCRQIFMSFAPPIENDTTAYINNMAGWLGVGPDDVLDLWQPGMLARALQACTRQEDGEQPYDDALINAAADAALKSVGARPQTPKEG